MTFVILQCWKLGITDNVVCVCLATVAGVVGVLGYLVVAWWIGR